MTKDLDKIKKTLRKEMGEQKLAEAYGTEYALTANPYATVTVDKEAVIKSLIGKRTAQIEPDDEITIKGADLIRLLTAASFSVTALKKIFTEDGMQALTTKTVKNYYSLKFNKQD
jgi:hypothetical protein